MPCTSLPLFFRGRVYPPDTLRVSTYFRPMAPSDANLPACSCSRYEGDNATTISYFWSATDATGQAAGAWSSQNTKLATVKFSAAGTYSIILKVYDGTLTSYCQVQSATKTFVAVCNAAPTSPTLTFTAPAGVVNGGVAYFDGSSFPEIVMTAAATDSNGDALTYKYTATGITGFNQDGSTGRFRPVALLGAFSVDNVTGLGSFARLPDTYARLPPHECPTRTCTPRTAGLRLRSRS